MTTPQGQDWSTAPGAEAGPPGASAERPLRLERVATSSPDGAVRQKKRAGIAAGSPWAWRGRGGTPRPNDMKSTVAGSGVQHHRILLSLRVLFQTRAELPARPELACQPEWLSPLAAGNHRTELSARRANMGCG